MAPRCTTPSDTTTPSQRTDARRQLDARAHPIVPELGPDRVGRKRLRESTLSPSAARKSQVGSKNLL